MLTIWLKHMPLPPYPPPFLHFTELVSITSISIAHNLAFPQTVFSPAHGRSSVFVRGLIYGRSGLTQLPAICEVGGDGEQVTRLW